MTAAALLVLRLTALAAAGGGLWSLESRRPLFATQDRWRHLPPNLALTALTLAVYALLGGVTLAAATWAAHAHAGLLRMVPIEGWIAAILGIAGLDLFAYFAHASMHKVPLLWRAHRVHHCEAAVDVTTTFRQHPAESLWRVAWQVAAVVAFGVTPAALLAYLSLSSLNALLEHANVAVPLRLDAALQRAWVTPNMHKWHHSRVAAQTDSNYGNLLSLWDRLFGSWTRPAPLADLRYGLAGHDDPAQQGFAALLRLPFTPAPAPAP